MAEASTDSSTDRTQPKRLQIAVIGDGAPGQSTADLAQEVGRLIAEGDGIVVCGGMQGVSETVCRGAKLAGGCTVGLIPGIDPQQANKFVDIIIPTGFGEARNAMVVRAGEVVIALPGQCGTLSEIAFALVAGKSVISLGAWKRDLPMTMAESIYEVNRAEEAVALAFRLGA